MVTIITISDIKIDKCSSDIDLMGRELQTKKQVTVQCHCEIIGHDEH